MKSKRAGEEAVLLGKALKKPLNKYLERLDKLNDV